MQLIDETIKFLKSEKEDRIFYESIDISFQDIQTDLRHKASTWIIFEDGSGELKLYEEDVSDVDWSGIGSDAVLGGLAFFIPVVGPLISGGVIGSRATKLTQSGKKTYVFTFNAAGKCVFAIVIYSEKSQYSYVNSFLDRVEEFLCCDEDNES